MPVLGSGRFQNVVVAGSRNYPKRFRSLGGGKQLLSKPQRDHLVAITLHEKFGHADPADFWK
jgi:hypothetical protein